MVGKNNPNAGDFEYRYGEVDVTAENDPDIPHIREQERSEYSTDGSITDHNMSFWQQHSHEIDAIVRIIYFLVTAAIIVYGLSLCFKGK